jgi:cytoplasmic iron level regulating protein YaaA (DUF328/UPF0246 family)
VLVLLPPSEGKTAPEAGDAVDLAALTSPELTEHRERVLDALARVSARPDALDVLHVGASLAEEVRRGATLRDQPAAPAAHVYTGVLYAAAGLASAHDDATSDGASVAAPDVAERLRARLDDVRVVSALWGVVTPSDRIPAYRLSMGVDLPGVGPLARSWREPLAKALDTRAVGDVVVDCRSATYAAAWRPPASAAHVPVTVLREHAGKRTVVSHHAKHTRGVLVGHLLRREGEPPTTPEGLLDAARELVGTTVDRRRIAAAELVPGRRAGSSSLELVVVDAP